MKTTVYFKQFLPALATLVTVGFASSCQDQNFDWDDAHAITAREKFTNVFIKEFGKPAEDHQWGFDMADFVINGELPTSTRAYFKYSTAWESLDKLGLEKPAPITEREHQEVYAWFSTHRVTWENSPSYLQDPRTNQLGNSSTAVYTPDNIITLYYTANNNGNGNIDKFVGEVNASGTSISPDTYKDNEIKDIAASSILGSLKYFPDNNATSNATVGTNITFTNGWVQRVASNQRTNDEIRLALSDLNENCSEFYTTGGQTYYIKDGNKFIRVDKNMNALYKYDNKYYIKKANEWYNSDSNCNPPYPPTPITDQTLISTLNGLGNDKKVTSDDEGTTSNLRLAVYSSLNKANQMNYLYAVDYDSKENEHIKDFNNAINGYGYLQETDWNLVTNANLNLWRYSSSTGSSFSDKYIIVKLEGYGYSGYYLGFDYEAWMEPINGEPSNRHIADGYCNDWIIKIGEVAPGGNKSGSWRIMCEDLGGDQTDANTPDASDIDYNDLVLDVNYTKTDGLETVELVLQAAGGTLPLTVWYNEDRLFETHEFFFSPETTNLTADDYKTMINTGDLAGGKTSTKAIKRYTLKFGANATGANKNYTTGHFSLSNLLIKVYRLGVEDYMDNDGAHTTSDAQWVTLNNMTGYAPLKICVPQTVKWLKERHKISDGYGDAQFRAWVKDPLRYFWQNWSYTDANNNNNSGTASINENHLYTPSSN